MDSIFLTPDVTFDVSIRTKFDKNGAPSFKIEADGPYRLRTATGREFAAIQNAFGREDVDATYKLCEKFVVSGIADGKEGAERSSVFGSLHPDVVYAILVEVVKRSRCSESDRGK